MARDIGMQMMLAEWLFVETVADLRDRSQDLASPAGTSCSASHNAVTPLADS